MLLCTQLRIALRILPCSILMALAAFMFILVASKAHAEKADANKPIDITSIKADDDDVKQIRTFTGNVVLVQGTLIMKGAKLVMVTSPDGWQFATLYAGNGSLATMRQKRDGGPDLWMEGQAAQMITYDQKSAVAKLFVNAQVRRLTGTKVTDEAKGKFLTYDNMSGIVNGDAITTTIQPHKQPSSQPPQSQPAP